jgi:hypothetical protein
MATNNKSEGHLDPTLAGLLATTNPVLSAAAVKRKASELEWDVLEDLGIQCNVCNEVPRKTPVYNCTNGHLLCSACKPKVSIIKYKK